VREQLLGCDGVLVWVNPISEGQNRTMLDALLREVAARGVWVSAHPDVILKMGVKEVLHRTKHLGWGTDTHLYRAVQAFREELQPFKNADGASSTLSVGVAIVHHLSLLNEALEQARAAEKAAKGVPGKNALAIKLCKRGGETYTISGHWNNLDLYLAQLITAYRLNRIPKGLPYDVRDSLLRLTALRDDEDTSALIAVIKDDTKRILKRKLQVPQRKRHPETLALLRLLESRIGIAWDEPPDQLQENAQEPGKDLAA